jgi:hypothetical protein
MRESGISVMNAIPIRIITAYSVALIATNTMILRTWLISIRAFLDIVTTVLLVILVTLLVKINPFINL